jgi:glycosyltransferase involved in cell wall biosynthesis
VDDGSSDSTPSVAAEYTKKDSRFKYIYQANKGLAGARNIGIKNSFGKFILPLDGDDLIDSLYIEKAVKILEKNIDVKVVYAFARFFGSKTNLWRLCDYSYSQLLLGNRIFCSCIYRRVDYDRVNGYDESMLVYEDWDFLIRLLYPNEKVFRIPEIMFFYRIRRGSLTHSADSAKKCLDTKKYIFKKNIDIYFEFFKKNPIALYGISETTSYKLYLKITWPFNLLRRIWNFIILSFR